MSARVPVFAVAPLWRYAVGPTDCTYPAIPYYRRGTAEASFEEVKRELPWASVSLYRRRWPFGIETIREYSGAAARRALADVQSLPSAPGATEE